MVLFNPLRLYVRAQRNRKSNKTKTSLHKTTSHDSTPQKTTLRNTAPLNTITVEVQDTYMPTRYPYLWGILSPIPTVTISPPGPRTPTSTPTDVPVFHSRYSTGASRILWPSLSHEFSPRYHLDAVLFIFIVSLTPLFINILWRLFLQRLFCMLFQRLCGILSLQGLRGMPSKPHRQPPQATVDRAFRTRDRKKLFSVICKAHNERWTNTPLRFSKCVQDAWHTPNRPWLQRLLEVGVIPLYIEDGGTSIERLGPRNGTEAWLAWLWELRRWVGWMKWEQVRKRAYFEFLVPNPRKPDARKRFLETLIMAQPRVDERHRNEDVAVERLGYGVTVRYHWKEVGPGSPKSTLYVSATNRPEGPEVPLVVSASSWFKTFLPRMPEEVVKPGYGANAHVLEDYIQDGDLDRIPTLKKTELAIVRVESRHFQRVELDAFVYHLAREAGMKRTWVGAENGA